jgi:general secretion pathway protein E
MADDSFSKNDLKGMAQRVGIPIYENLLDLPPLPRNIYRKIPYGFVKKHKVLPIKEENGVMLIAASDPFNLDPFDDLRVMLESELRVVFSPEEQLQAAIHDAYNREQGEASQEISELGEASETGSGEEIEVYDLLDDGRYLAPVIKILNLIILEAIQQGASDIHFEPYEGGLRIRYRIDGVLQNRHSPAPEFQLQIISRLKVMAKLDIAEHRLPQDGRIKLKMGRREIDFRVSTVPVHGGERVVLRILDKGNVILGLNKMGMSPDILDTFKKLIQLPEGIILVTGPTGSGKTTTLYSAISDLYNDEINIMTIEDPVEYNLRGIAQIGVQPKIKLDFARGLRHILRQDPDVIMIGEVRDRETAEIAIQSSLTGHLVMSTLHTNDAPSAITRLVDMGTEPYLLSSTIVGVLAQRLVRRICKECMHDVPAKDEELTSLGIKRYDIPGGVLKAGKGCSSCFGSGYKGRHAIYELMVVNNRIQKQIIKSADSIELRRIALETGMKSLLSHGVDLVKSGVTTVQEVLRVTRGFDD